MKTVNCPQFLPLLTACVHSVAYGSSRRRICRNGLPFGNSTVLVCPVIRTYEDRRDALLRDLSADARQDRAAGFL